MVRTVRIDTNRLVILKQMRDAAFAASSMAQDDIRELHRKRTMVEAEIGKAISNASQNMVLMDRRELASATDKLEEKRLSLTKAMEDAGAKAEPLYERRTSLGRLYENCAQFAGVQIDG